MVMAGRAGSQPVSQSFRGGEEVGGEEEWGKEEGREGACSARVCHRSSGRNAASRALDGQHSQVEAEGEWGYPLAWDNGPPKQSDTYTQQQWPTEADVTCASGDRVDDRPGSPRWMRR